MKITPEGKQFIETPTSFQLIKEVDFDIDTDDAVSVNKTPSGGAADPVLFAVLKDLRKKVANERSLPPFVIFQDPSLEEMAVNYPITIDELTMIGGVGRGKAMKFGAEFISVIKKYVDENNIERAQDMLVKSMVNKSGSKVSIIQNIDRKLPLEDIAEALGKKTEDIIEQIETIVASGTKINIDYYIDDILDEDSQEDIYGYFMEAESDSIEDAVEEFDGDFTEEELRLMRVKFISEVGN